MTTINFEDVKSKDSLVKYGPVLWDTCVRFPNSIRAKSRSFILAYASVKARPLIWMLLTLPQNN